MTNRKQKRKPEPSPKPEAPKVQHSPGGIKGRWLVNSLSFVLVILAVPQLLRFAGTQEDYFDAAQVYLRIYLAGLMFTVIYNNAAGILRALGRADVPFRILVG